MAKFHISKDGQARSCSAKINCRLGGEDRHYDTAEAARAAFEKEAEEKFGSMIVLSRGISEPHGGGMALNAIQLDSGLLKPFSTSKAETDFIKEKAKTRLGELNDRLKSSNAEVADSRQRYLALHRNPANRIFKRAEIKKAREDFLANYVSSSKLESQISSIHAGVNTLNQVRNQVERNVSIPRRGNDNKTIADNLKKQSSFYGKSLSEDFYDARSSSVTIYDPIKPERLVTLNMKP